MKSLQIADFACHENLKTTHPNIIYYGKEVLLLTRTKNFLKGGRGALRFVNGGRKIRILYLLPELRFKEMARFLLSLKFDAECL